VDEVRRIGIVSVTYNSARVLPEFLESVFAQTFGDFVLYLIDNASRDNSVEMVSQCTDPRVCFIANPENLGVAEGNNQEYAPRLPIAAMRSCW
jgi:GT2 family glycosyltransferase